MSQIIVQSSNLKKYSSLSMGGSMKKLVKNCKHFFFKYDVQQKNKLSHIEQTASQLQTCWTEEEHQNWLNEQMEIF